MAATELAADEPAADDYNGVEAGTGEDVAHGDCRWLDVDCCKSGCGDDG